MYSIFATSAMVSLNQFRALKRRQEALDNAFLEDPDYAEVVGFKGVIQGGESPSVAANAASGESVSMGTMIAGLVILMLIEFVAQFLAIWFFSWLLMKVVGVPFAYFGGGVIFLLFLLGWFVNMPNILNRLEAQKRQFTGEGLTPQEKNDVKKQFFLGYVINLLITVIVLLLVAKIVGVPTTLPGGEPLPIPNLDTEQLATALVIGFFGQLGAQIFGGAKPTKAPYASVLMKRL